MIQILIRFLEHLPLSAAEKWLLRGQFTSVEHIRSLSRN